MDCLSPFYLQTKQRLGRLLGYSRFEFLHVTYYLLFKLTDLPASMFLHLPHAATKIATSVDVQSPQYPNIPININLYVCICRHLAFLNL